MKHVSYILIFILLQSCDLFDAHPFDGKVTGEIGINSKNIRLIEDNCLGKQTIRFAMISDTQRRYDETKDFVNSLNKRNDIDFVIHGGDISDFGVTNEFMLQRDILNKLKIPYVVLLGNHDCLATGEYVYREIFGYENFSFIAGNIKFICLNTNAIECDCSIPIPNLEFIDSQLHSKTPNHEKTIFAMHAPPYSEQFNNNVADIFQSYIKRFHELQFCIYAHVHYIYATEIFNDGVMYYSSASIEQRNYLLFTISPDGHNYEIVYY